MKRIIFHWTAGTHKVSATDKKHYHFIIAGDGTVHFGKFGPKDNLDTSTPYAAHTRMANTGAIGIAVAAMHGAKERPFGAGKYPITTAQVDALAKLIAQLSEKYNIPIEGDRVLSHAEVQPTLGIKQRGKWDITWLPGMTKAGDPIAVGKIIREHASAEFAKREATRVRPIAPKTDPVKPSGLVAIIKAIMAIFKGKTS